MDPISYCRDKVLQPGSSFYYSLLRLPNHQRDGLTALFTVCQEIQTIPDETQEESVARTKLQWWAEEFQRLLMGEPRHPATQALLATFQQQQLPSALFEELLTSTELKLDVDHCCTTKDYLLYCYREVGIRTILAAYVNGFTEQQTIKFAHELGVSLAITHDIIHLRNAIKTGRVYFPLDELNQFEIETEQLNQFKTNENLVNLLRHQAEKARQHYQKALSLLPKADKAQQRHNLVYSKLQMKLLDEVEKDGFQVLKHQIQLTPLHKFWVAWRSP